ncbi:hypothetical protein EK904_001315, partial [Melospiza melodia maxima]
MSHPTTISYHHPHLNLLTYPPPYLRRGVGMNSRWLLLSLRPKQPRPSLPLKPPNLSPTMFRGHNAVHVHCPGHMAYPHQWSCWAEVGSTASTAPTAAPLP